MFSIKIHLFFLFFIFGCSSQRIDLAIENQHQDILNEESFNRYNSLRLSSKESSSEDFISKANLACHQGKFYKGKSLLESKMHESKNNPFYWATIGTCFWLENDDSKALFFYQTGIESLRFEEGLKKKILEATLLNNIGLLHLKYKRFNEAFDSFTKAHELAPHTLTPVFNLAQLYLEFNMNVEAYDLLKKLNMQNPLDNDILYSLSLICIRKKDFTQSYAYIKKIDPALLNRSDIAGVYAFYLLSQNRLIEAKAQLEKQITSNEYNTRNKLLLEEIDQKIKESKKE